MIYVLCIIGLLALSALLYIFVTGGVAMIVCAVEDDDDLDLAIFIAWLIGCILFVFLVVEWATVKCPFFIGDFIGR